MYINQPSQKQRKNVIKFWRQGRGDWKKQTRNVDINRRYTDLSSLYEWFLNQRQCHYAMNSQFLKL